MVGWQTRTKCENDNVHSCTKMSLSNKLMQEQLHPGFAWTGMPCQGGHLWYRSLSSSSTPSSLSMSSSLILIILAMKPDLPNTCWYDQSCSLAPPPSPASTHPRAPVFHTVGVCQWEPNMCRNIDKEKCTCRWVSSGATPCPQGLHILPEPPCWIFHPDHRMKANKMCQS